MILKQSPGAVCAAIGRSSGGPAPAAFRPCKTLGMIPHTFVPPRAASEGPLALRQIALPKFNRIRSHPISGALLDAAGYVR